MADDIPPCKVLVRTLNDMEPNKKCKVLVQMLNDMEPNIKSGVEFNFHLVDLKKKKIELNYIPAIPIMEGAAMGKMAMLDSESDSCIYILGDVLNPTKLKLNKEKYEEEGEETKHIHSASSKYSLGSNRWDAFDVPIQTNVWSIPAIIFDKLYCFGFPWCLPKVYENGWKDLELPHHLIHRQVSLPIIPDRKNNRYLVHFSNSGDIYSGDIYAFHPNSPPSSDATANAGEWTCVVNNFNEEWTPPVAVSGNILFFQVFMIPGLITAYDMSANKWLKVVADFTRVGQTLSLFHDMFTLPENHDVLCLASGLRSTSTSPAGVDILRIRFNHTIGSNQLSLTALDYQSYHIPIPSTVYDFLLL